MCFPKPTSNTELVHTCNLRWRRSWSGQSFSFCCSNRPNHQPKYKNTAFSRRSNVSMDHLSFWILLCGSNKASHQQVSFIPTGELHHSFGNLFVNLSDIQHLENRSFPPLYSSFCVATCHSGCLYPVYQPARWQSEFIHHLKQTNTETNHAFMVLSPDPAGFLFTEVAGDRLEATGHQLLLFNRSIIVRAPQSRHVTGAERLFM